MAPSRLGMLLALLVLTLSVPTALAGCYRDKSLKKHIPYEDKFYNHKPTPLLKEEDLPETFVWCNHTDGNNYCTASWNQHIPRYCGGCWAHATLSMVQDRLKIKKKAKGIDVMLARQVLLNCGKQRGHGEGCNGGDTYDVFKYMTEYGLPDEGCMPYNATDHTKYKKWKYCPAHAQCINCMPAGEGDDYVCWPIKKFIKYYLTSWGVLAKGEHAMKSEIASRGPIVCGAVCPDDFTYNYRGGVYKDTTGETELDHDVEIVGWGVEPDGTKYWLARNSWGAYWGELGFFKLERGVNALQIENGDCWYAEVDNEIEREIEDGELVGSMYGLVDKDSGDDDHEHRHHDDEDDDDEGGAEDSMARVVEPEEAMARLESAKLRSRKVIAST